MSKLCGEKENIYSKDVNKFFSGEANRELESNLSFTFFQDKENSEQRTEYGIWANPNDGELADKMFGVGYIGDLTIEDDDKLIEALYDLKDEGVI